MRALAIVHEQDAGPGVFAEAIAPVAELETWLPREQPQPPADPFGYDAVISFGGSMHPDQEDGHPWLSGERALLEELLARGLPLLGICLGAHLLSEAAGAETRRLERPEIGWWPVTVSPAGEANPLFAPLAPCFEAFQWHSYEFSLPPGATVLAQSESCLQAWRLGNAWAVQFHAEVSAVDARAWIDDWESDEDAVRIGLDQKRLRAETEARIGPFNQLGRELCRRWLEVAGLRATPAG